MTLRLVAGRPKLTVVSDGQPRRLGQRFDRRFCAALVRVPVGLGAAAQALGVPAGAFAVRDGALQADFEVPVGSWRLWTRDGLALWTGARRGVQVPGAAASLEPVTVSLLGALRTLEMAGVWPERVRLRHPQIGYGPQMSLFDAQTLLSDPGRTVTGLCGHTHLDGVGGDVELTADGRAYAEHRRLAERLLLLACGVEGPVPGSAGWRLA